MTKKVSHIILSFLLLIATMGLTISKHYCGEELISVEVFSEAESCCDMNDGCCHNESETIQVEDDFIAATFDISFEQVSIVLPTLFLISGIVFQEDEQVDLRNHPPLPPPPIHTFLARLQRYLL